MKMMKALCLVLTVLTVISSGAVDSPWGIAAHPLRQAEWSNIDKELEMMKQAGITSLRTDMAFSGVARQKGTYDFTRYDALLAKLDEAGIGLLPILEGYDSEISKTRPDVTPLYQHPEAWRGFVRAAARHYKGRLKTWEIWNEQDGGFWKPEPNAAQYVLLLKIAYEELKAADPENVVLVGGLCGWVTGYLSDMYAAGAKGYFDGVCVHPYGWGPERSASQAAQMAEFKAVMAKHGDAGKKIWITECGGPTHSGNLLKQQPDVINRAIALAAKKIGRKLPEKLVAGYPVSRLSDTQDFSTTRGYLPGVEIIPVSAEELGKIDPARLPVMIGCDGTIVEEPYRKAMLDYVKKGGILLALGEVPFYYLRYRNEKGNWANRPAASELHPQFRIGFEAWWTRQGLPEQTTRVKTAPAGLEAGIVELSNVYVTRFLTGKNMKKGDTYTPLVDVIGKEGEVIGQGIALHTYKDWRGAIIGCTLQYQGGYTEKEQAHLLQTLYLSYLANGVERLYFYDFHSDGPNPAEREHNYGIVRWDFQPKPAYYAYRDITAALGRAPRFLKQLPSAEGTTALLFERAEGGKVKAVWSKDSAVVFSKEP